MWNPRAFLPPKLKHLVRKNGQANLVLQGIPRKREKFLKDIFTSLVQIQWRWNLIIFISGFVLSWYLFAAYYFVIESTRKVNNSSYNQPCITNVKSFVSTLLFSIETQTTIGYGFRHVTEACPHVFVVVMLQSIFGIVTQVILAGIVIAKLKRGKNCCSTVFFSNSACVYEQDGDFYFTVRLADIRKSQTVVRAHARGLFMRKQYCQSGNLPVGSCNMKMTGEDGQPYLFTSWPSQIVHKINQRSPFWNMTRDHFLKVNFEVMVILEGVVASTGRPFRTCVSYLPWDISWGNRFVQLDFTEAKSSTYIDYTNFHKTKAVKTPWLSPRDLCRNKRRDVRPCRREAPVQILLSVPEPGIRSCRSEEAKSPCMLAGGRHIVSDTFLGSLSPKIGGDWL